MSIQVQVCVQGGGARIANLLGAAQALRDLEAGNRLRVTRIAGTSAGAIAAALFAVRSINLDSVVARLVEHRQWIRARLPQLPGGPLQALWRLHRDGRLADLSALEELLAAVFPPELTFGKVFEEFGTELVIVSTNLAYGATVAESSGDRRVLSAILDSCSIPFVFRGPTKKSDGDLVVDGGVCENLYVDGLLPFEKESGPVYAISFKEANGPRGRKDTHTLAHFAQALVETAVDHSTKRASIQLGRSRVLELVTQLGTLDFDNALMNVEDHARGGRLQTRNFFEASVQREVAAARRLSTDVPEATQRMVWEIYDGQNPPGAWRIDEYELFVSVRCLEHPSPTEWTHHPDLVRYRVSITPTDQPVISFGALLVAGKGEPLRSMSWDARDSENRTIETRNLPAMSDQGRGFVAHFLEPLRANGGSFKPPYTVAYSHDVAGAGRKLLDRGWADLLLSTTRSGEVVPCIRIVVEVPEGIELTWSPSPRDTSGIVGREMTPAECKSVNKDPAPGYRNLGWIGEDVPPSRYFGVRLFVEGGGAGGLAASAPA